MKKYFLYICALALVAFAFPFPSFSSESITNDILGSLGVLDEENLTDSDLWVVHIKDAHCNPDAQFNSIRIIKNLVQKYNFSLICLEGNASSLSVNDLASFPDEEAKNDVLINFIKNGKINGVEYLSIQSPDKILVEGIENKKLYIENYYSFYKSLSFRKKGLLLLDNITDYLVGLKPIYFSDDLLRIDKQYNEYIEGTTTVFDFFQVIDRYASQTGIKLTPYKNISILASAAKLKTAIDFTKVESEKDSILKECLKYASEKDRRFLLETNMKYKFNTISTDDFYNAVIGLCDEYLIDIDDFKNFSKCREYSRILQSIDHTRLLAELKEAYKSIKESLYDTKYAKNLDNLIETSQTFKEACRLCLPPHSAKRLSKLLKNFNKDDIAQLMDDAESSHNIVSPIENNTISFITYILSYVCDFYQKASQRNNALIENTILAMKQNHANRCVLYSGGFHTDGIRRLLKEKNISYSIISPNIGHTAEDKNYYSLLSNKKDKFLQLLESNLKRSINKQSDTLALESKLVPSSEVMLDPLGAESLRNQIKSFYVCAGIRNALEPIKATILPLLEPLDESRLTDLSDRIAKIAKWKLKNFVSLENFSLIRNEDKGIDLKLTISGQDFFVRNIIVPDTRKTPLEAFQDTALLTTLNVGGSPIAIYSSQKSGDNQSFSLNELDSSDITDMILLFSDSQSVSEKHVIDALPQSPDKTQALIDLLIAQNILDRKKDNNLALNYNRSEILLSASQMYRDINQNWTSFTISDLQKYSFPEKFLNFLNEQNILKIELPDTVTFPALLFLIENLYKEFDKTAVFPYSKNEVFVIKKEKILGEDGYRLFMDKQNADLVESTLKERQILLGADYTDTIKQQLFGAMPVEKTKILSTAVSESSVVVFDPSKSGSVSQIIWSDPALTSIFWREINQSTFNYSKEKFVVTGGLLFGAFVGGRYVVTDIVPLGKDDYSFQDDEKFVLNPDKIEKYLNKYVTGDKKLIGIYRNHSPERLAKYAEPGVDRRDALTGFPFDSRDKRVIANPLGIVFEPSLSNEALEKLRQDDVSSVRLIDPASSSVYFYNQVNGEPQVLHKTSAYKIVTPGEQLFETTERNLYLRRINQAQTGTENTVVTFRRLPENRGFVLLAGASVSQDEIRFFIQFFQSIRKEIEIFSDVKEIQIKSGMKKSAHLNRDDSIIEFSTEILSYPSLIKYLALPHEWNHFLINIKNKELEEIITVMYDFLRISQLMLKDKPAANHFLRELEEYEEPYQGKQLFLEALRKMQAKVQAENRFLSPFEFWDFAIGYIKSDPDLYALTKNLLAKEDKEYFVNKFTATMKKTQYDIPPVLPGEQDYIIFDDATLGKAYTVTTSVIDFMQLRPKYLSGSNFFERASGLAKSPDLNFQDVTGFFDPSSKELGINISNPYHLNADGTVNPDMILSTIIRQQTHYLLHRNPGVLDKLVEQINSDEKVKNEILKYFLILKRSQIPGLNVEEEQPETGTPQEQTEKEKGKKELIKIRKGKIVSTITKEQLDAIAEDPTFATDGQINYRKIVNEIIAASNGFNTVISALAKYSDIKTKLETEGKPVPNSLAKKISDLQQALFKPNNILLFKLSENAEKYITAQDERLADIFRIPHFSVTHILFDESTNVLETPVDDIHNTIEDQKNVSPDKTAVNKAKPQETKPDFTPILQNSVSTEQFNNFLTALRTAKQLPPAVPVQYNKEISYLNAREFFNYLLDRKNVMPMSSLPEDITVTDIYLGNHDYIKDFLDKFKELDVNNYFYSRLRYNIISHSPSSQLLLNKLERSKILDEHKNIVSYKSFTTFKQADNDLNSAILVRSFGDMALFSNAVLIEKKGDSFFLVTGQPKINNAAAGKFPVDQLAQLIKDPSSITETQTNNLTPKIIDAIQWDEKKVSIDIENLPFGSFLKSYTQNNVDGRFVFHPDLLHSIHQSLSSMAMNFGGYWQVNGNSFGSLPNQIIKPEETLTELDSAFLAAIIEEQGGFIFESQEAYLNRNSGGTTILPVIDELRRIDTQTLSALFLPVTFSDINNSARIFNMLQNPTYKSADPFTFQRFIRELKNNGLIPPALTASLKIDPVGTDNFLYSLTEALKSQVKWDKIANAFMETAKSTNSAAIDEFITEIMANTDIKDSYLSRDYFMKIYGNIAVTTKNKKDFHLKAEVLAPENTVSAASAKKAQIQPVSENVIVKIRKLNQNQFNAYIEQIKRDHPHLDFNDPRGIANPVAREIVINSDHPDHKNPDGTPNLPGYRQTVIHEKTHMLTFKHWDILTEIADNMRGTVYLENEVIKLFYEFYFEEKIDSVTQEHRKRLQNDPLWSINGEISYERLISELLSVINEYRMLPTLMKKLASIERQLSMHGKTVPPVIAQGQRQINEIFARKKAIISSTVSARQKLNLIDQRLTSTFLFDSKILNVPIVMQEFDIASLPLPSTPIQTVFSDGELNFTINKTWAKLGIGDINRGKIKTRLSGLQLNEFQTALASIASRNDITGTDQQIIGTALDFWNAALSSGKVHLYPSSPESYTIQGSHFLHVTEEGDIIIAKGFFDHLRETKQLAQAAALWGAKLNDLSTDTIETHFNGKPIAELEKQLFDEFLKNKDYLPVLNDIFALYGIKIDEISNQALKKIIEKHKNILTLPGIKNHLQKIKNIISRKALLNYEQSPVAEAFKLYAQTLMTPDEILQLRDAVIDISTIITRETSAPVIFLIDYKTVSGDVSPQNFALRESIKRVKQEIELLEQKNVLLIAVDINGKTAGEIRQSLDGNLLRKGAASDDFDYVVSYKNADNLLNALQQEFKDIPPQTLKSNLKILTRENNPLVTLAKDNKLAYQTINENTVEANLENGQGIFLIDYLRSLGIPNFISTDSSALAVEMKNAMHITSISEFIDLTDINQKFKPFIKKFADTAIQFPDKSLDELFNLFFERETVLNPQDWQYLLPLLEEQFLITRSRTLLSEKQKSYTGNTARALSIFKKLKSSFDKYPQTNKPAYSKLLNDFFSILSDTEKNYINSRQFIETELKKANIFENISDITTLIDLYERCFFKRDQLTNSEFFIVNNVIKSDGKSKPVSFNEFSELLAANEITLTPQLSRYFHVEIAPKPIHQDIRKLMATQKLFDEAA
ncbi:hypothetical protein J7L67_02665 [bacterium]|nr:hypothetical protein [bacterium]